MPQCFSVIRSAGAAALGLAVAGCAGGAGSLAPPGGAMQAASRFSPQSHVGRARPALTSVEYFNGIPSGAEPRGVAKGPGGIWFTEFGTTQIGRIATNGTVTQFSLLPTSTTPNNIVEGPDHNMWFTETGSDVVGRITSKGKVTEFSAGNEAYGPWDIVAGPDGNLWFTYRSPSTDAIGRITTAGVVTLFTNGLSPGDPAVHDIAAGPDGNIWFTEEFGNRIGRCTTSGTITEFSSGITQNAGLVDIASGPDGDLWFTEYNANQIGRITPSGTVTEFSSGISSGAEPGSITSAKGYVWFTEEGSNPASIGRVSKNGTITEFGVDGALNVDLVAGPPSSDLWLTDYSGNGIVQVTE